MNKVRCAIYTRKSSEEGLEQLRECARDIGEMNHTFLGWGLRQLIASLCFLPISKLLRRPK